jgi:predicted GIY-YIG superfamily endonuclease
MYVYLLTSNKNPTQHYIGATNNLKQRLKEHNASKAKHTSKHAPWHIEVALFFKNQEKAEAFEIYLKKGSGHAFAKRHFW